MLRELVDNVLSGMKAGFKAILNLEHPFARRKMGLFRVFRDL